jgi:hypothetical protein
MVLDDRQRKTSSNEGPRKQVDDPHDDCSHWCGKM